MKQIERSCEHEYDTDGGQCIHCGQQGGLLMPNASVSRQRLAPNYQQPVKRWWFHPRSIDMMREMEVAHSTEQPDHSPGWIEVSEGFARYVHNKPDCECELRPPEDGDDYFTLAPAGAWHTSRKGIFEAVDYRWCKPRKPRYEVKNHDGIKYVWDNKGKYALCQGSQMQDMHRIAKSMNERENKALAEELRACLQTVRDEAFGISPEVSAMENIAAIERGITDLRREYWAMRDALQVRINYMKCQECGEWIEDGKHAETCRHYETEKKLLT